MSRKRVRGYIIRRIPMGETSGVVTLLTEELGKLKCVAKGARKTASRRGNALDLFALVQGYLQGREHGDLGLLTGFEVVAENVALAADPLKFGYASALCELVDKALQLGQPQPAIFALMQEYFAALVNTETANARGLFLAGCVRLLAALGYEPQLEVCAVCGKPNPGKAAYYLASAGGIVCRKEAAPISGCPKLSAATLVALKQMLKRPLVELGNVSYPSRVQDEAQRFIFAFAAYHIGLRTNLKSLKFLSQF